MNKKVVCVGGGTGVSMVLSGLKKYPLDLTAIVTMFDNGGSSGKLRKELGILPLGDVRACLSVLSREKTVNPFFYCRFQRGALKGHNVGNLLIAAAEQITGSLEKAIKRIGIILKVKGNVLPVTLKSSHIKVLLKNGKQITGEEEIVNYQNLSKAGIKKISLVPPVNANPSAILAIKEADVIIIGPGKFYTSIIPNLLVGGISKAIAKSRAKKIFIANLMTQAGNTDNLKVEDFSRIIEEYLGKNIIDWVIFNTKNLSPDLLKEVRKTFPRTKAVDFSKDLLKSRKFIGKDILDPDIKKINPNDILIKKANKRTMVLHDSDKLAKIIINLCKL
ncbi:MAG: gluconeogenesis factor YvcK family protein [Patescibacteria group bacterium]